MDSNGVEDSWDFFDTKPGPQEDEPVSVEYSASKPPARPKSAKHLNSPKASKVIDSTKVKEKEKGSKGRQRSGSSSGSSRSRSSSYSSHSDTDSKDKSSPRREGKVSKHSRKSLSDSDRSRSSSSSGSRSSRSRSRSFSDSDSKSGSEADGRPGNPVAKSLPHRGRSRLGEDEYSSSAYSDGDEDGTNKNNSRSSASGQGVKRQAWSDEVTNESSIKVPTSNSRSRPKTAKGKKTVGGRRNRSRSQSEDSEALSDSDMTDVSPIDSPRNSKLKAKKGAARGEGEVQHMQFRALPVSGADEHHGEEYEQQPSGLDLEILMKAVGELEKQKRLQENSRRVMFAPMTLKRSEKSNYTFDKSKTRDIERENQRLLKEIVRRVNKSGEKKRQPAASAYKLTASAINRERDMKRIESENLAFLRRLQKVQPTRGMRREAQLQSYNSTTLHGVPIAALHPMPRRGGSRSAFDDTSSIGSHTRSITSINSVVSSVRSGKSSRQSSRPSSATKRVDARPQWSDRW